MAIFLLASWRYTSQSKLCASCHEVRPNYETWARSSHNKVACTTCHGGTKIKGLAEIYKHITRSYNQPLRLKSPIRAEVCQECHTVSRVVTASGDLIVPHRWHIESGKATCFDCHRNVAHAGIEGDEGESWLGHLQGLTARSYRPQMKTCMNCHDGKKAPSKCDFCHKQIRLPDTHRARDWKTGHGTVAKKEYRGCIFCHAIAANQQPSQKTLTLGEAVRSNSFCTNCHTRRPPSHTAEWQVEHKYAARRDREGCPACHEERPEGTGGSPWTALRRGVVACSRCHEPPHPEGWRGKHPTLVKEKGIASCFKCHASYSCSRCHTGEATRP